jgi:phosphopentomutase
MNTRWKTYLFMSSLSISAVMVALLAFGISIIGIAAQSNNTTDGSQLLTNGSQNIGGQIPDAALQSILEQTQSANATGFAIGNIINQTGISNATQIVSDNTTMKSVIEEARNTNATSFAADNIINQTQSGNNTKTN